MKVGTFALLDSPTAVEMAGFAGLDFVIIDCEHSTNTSPYGSDFVNMLRAATAGGIPAYVRVRVNDYGMIATALDVGAAGIIVPGVSSAQDMRRAVEAATWQPRGKRGAAPFGRIHRYGFSAIDIVPVMIFRREVIALWSFLGGLFISSSTPSTRNRTRKRFS